MGQCDWRINNYSFIFPLGENCLAVTRSRLNSYVSDSKNIIPYITSIQGVGAMNTNIANNRSILYALSDVQTSYSFPILDDTVNPSNIYTYINNLTLRTHVHIRVRDHYDYSRIYDDFYVDTFFNKEGLETFYDIRFGYVNLNNCDDLIWPATLARCVAGEVTDAGERAFSHNNVDWGDWLISDNDTVFETWSGLIDQARKGNSSAISFENRSTFELNIPASITSIAQSFWSGAGGITKLTLHENLETIGSAAFAGYYEYDSTTQRFVIYTNYFEDIHFPSTVENIGNGAFNCNPYIRLIEFLNDNYELNPTGKDTGDYIFGHAEYGMFDSNYNLDYYWSYKDSDVDVRYVYTYVIGGTFNEYTPRTFRSWSRIFVTQIGVYSFYKSSGVYKFLPIYNMNYKLEYGGGTHPRVKYVNFYNKFKIRSYYIEGIYVPWESNGCYGFIPTVAMSDTENGCEHVQYNSEDNVTYRFRHTHLNFLDNVE